MLKNVFPPYESVLSYFRLYSSRKMPKKKSASSSKEKEENKVQNPVTLDKSGNIMIKILAKPGAKLNAITGISEEGVGVQINAPPVEGEANTELIQYISSILKVRKSDVSLDRGSRSRNKTLIVTSSGSIGVDIVLEKLKAEINS
ncbi:UPF0235 protein C15orf40 homolog [Ischnura elegans]|uniref:UPF0235 protein C15orf40 homolog n=1 Tax=Ischnura elegans TaxID=197161 RepID=UPI001ED86DC9|nr:UPF0235 protein C15orf40 homolog [Ischnura elegans]